MTLPKIIIGKKITLHILNKKHFKPYHKMLSNTVRTILHIPPATYKQTAEFLDGRLEKVKKNKLLFYSIFDNIDNTLIGSIEIRELQKNPGQLGAWLNENYWGQGRYQEALGLAIKTYLEWKNVSFVTAYIDVVNTRSIKAHQKFGFTIIDKQEQHGRPVYNMVYRD